MEIHSPAKINLFLHVTGKREDNYHNIVTLMCCVGLYDTIRLNFDTRDITLTCSDPNVPLDSTNLAVRAARLFFQTLNIHDAVDISITKNIPVAGGLGGGSSNAAAVLIGLNRHYGHPLSNEDLRALGLKLGADVPFFIFRKPAIATGIGEKLEACIGLPPFQVVLIYPGFGISTGEVYKKLNLGLTNCKKKVKEFHFYRRHFNAMRHLCNDLESVTASKHPDIMEAKAALLKHGAMGALMSGSGPSVFGLFSDRHIAERAELALSRKSDWQVFCADMVV
jgi:4-diphosphocytidyl-2-C-methyl-D-erythritol kinase